MNISEIAKMAGVSRAAVSRYFNDGYISQEKRDAIRKVVEETGYRPSRQAQILRTKKTRMIGVVIPKVDSPSIGKIVLGIVSVLNECGYQLLLANTQNDPEKEKEYLKAFRQTEVDGVILVGTVFTPAHDETLEGLKIPVVITDQQRDGFCCVLQDDYHATYDITKLVISKGRKNIGFIGVLPEDEAAGRNRYNGYADAARDSGLSEAADHFVIADFTVDSGYHQMKEYCRQFGVPEAVVCATDRIAAGVMQCLRDMGYQVPRDIYVTGQGDSDMSDVTSPRLTTVHYNYEETGSLSAKQLLKLIDKEEEVSENTIMDYHLVEKESTL